MHIFKEIVPEEIVDSTFKLIGKDWMLITAGNRASFNTMTAAWGGFGIMWQKKVIWCVIRPGRYTYEFVERSSFFTLSFFEEQYREMLTYCGSRSGRNVNKVKETGLTPVFDEDNVYFTEARLVLECKKIYFQDLIPGHFIASEIMEFYPQKDYHRMYIAEIVKCLTK